MSALKHHFLFKALDDALIEKIVSHAVPLAANPSAEFERAAEVRAAARRALGAKLSKKCEHVSLRNTDGGLGRWGSRFLLKAISEINKF